MGYAFIVRCTAVALAFIIGACASFKEGDDVAPSGDGGASNGGDAEGDDGGTGPGDGGASYAEAVMQDQPLLYWRLDEPSGAAARDRSGNMLDGTYSPNVVLDQPSLLGDENASVLIEAGGSVDGPIDNRLAFEGNAPFTVECWISFASPVTGVQTILSRGSETTASGYSLWLDADDGTRAHFGRYEAGQGAYVTSGGGAAAVLAAGTRHHVVGVYDGGTITIHVDGRLGESLPNPTKLIDHSYRLRIGRGEDGPGALSARVDEVAVYNRALPPDRIQAHHMAAR
jgi:hypothetical protein